MNRTPVVLDMDPGVDDALAIILALKSGLLDVKAITICGGNVGLDQCALNALKTIKVIDPKCAVPVARGASRPVSRSPFRAGGIHGPDGLGGVKDRYPDHPIYELDSRNGVDVILETARLYANDLVIIATGPLTNIALAISKDPEVMRNVKRIFWMGGSFATTGNITPVAEFNAFCDPEAAQEVLSFGVPMMVVGLDACMQCPLRLDELEEEVSRHPSDVGEFAQAITGMYMDFYHRQENFLGCYLHDPLAVAVAIWPDIIIKSQPHHVHMVTHGGIAQGMTIIDRRPRNPWLNKTCKEALERVGAEELQVLREFCLVDTPPHVDVVLEVNRTAFLERFKATCFT